MEKFAFIFPGQGTQFPQMGKSFYESYMVAKKTFDEASEILGMDMAKLCFEGKVSDLNRFTNMQLAIVTCEVAIFRAYMEDFGIAPQFGLGHSIGEYAALVCAGAVEFSDALRMLKKRGELVERVLAQRTGHMTIVEKISRERLHELVDTYKDTQIACYNTQNQHAISGKNEEMDQLEQKLIEENGTISPLLFSPPMHCKMMQEIKQEYYAFLQQFTYYPFRFAILSNFTGKPFSNVHAIPEILSEHLVSPVLFEQSLQYLPAFGITATVEMSPKLLLSIFVRECDASAQSYCYGVAQDRQILAELFQSDSNYAKDKPDFLGGCLKIIAATRNYNDDPDNYKLVSRLYNDLKKSYIAQKESKFASTGTLEANAFQMLLDVLALKRLGAYETKACLKQLLDENNAFYRFAAQYKTL